MKTIKITDYYSGKTLKTLKIKTEESIIFNVEKDKFVVRNYHTNKIIKSVKAPTVSIRFNCI